MSFKDVHARRLERERARRARVRRRRAAAAGTLIVVALVAAGIAIAAGGGASPTRASHAASSKPSAGAHGSGAGTGGAPSTVAAKGTGVPGNATVPILMYHVINPPPAGAPFPGLYVPADEFAQQMQALKSAGWHGVTMDQLRANWTRGVPLGPGKPIVITFDNGYTSQYTNALPVLKQLGWVGVENIQLLGLPPSQGGLPAQPVPGL